MPAIKVFSWAQTRRVIPGIYPAGWINPTDTRGDADFMAGRLANELAPRDPANRALIISVPLGYTLDQHVIRHTIKDFLLQTVATSKTKNWFLQFYDGLKRRNAAVGTLIMDEESNLTNWAFENYGSKDKTLPTYLHQLWADPAVQAKMPDNLKRYSIDMVLQKDFNAVCAWNEWTMGILCQMIRDVVVTPYVQVFGSMPVVSNWENFRGTFQTFDVNGWPLAQVRVGDWSSPACYVGSWGRRQNTPESNRKKDPSWNRFLDCINFVRSAVAFDGQCMPWISYRSWVEGNRAPTPVQWLWNQHLLHTVATGVDRMIYWNQKGTFPATDEEDNALGDLIAMVAQADRVVRQLPEIPMDADEVTTGDVTTRYADYIANPNPSLNLQSRSRLPVMRAPSRQWTPNVTLPSGIRVP